MFVINSRKSMREYLELVMRQAKDATQHAKTVKDKSFAIGRIAGIQEGINGLDDWDKCQPEDK